ncbi:MAG: thiamine phosphate synthase [Dehalococcoidia bacterium]|tara:strand:- start:203 stop:841 length:639 start_codon:yes stop_codon:yes gene_type:complete
MSRNPEVSGVYTIIDPEATKNRNIFEITKQVLSGGVKVFQYRDKINDRSEFLENAFKLKELSKDYSACFVINDAVDIARIVGADYIHVGQSDLPVKYCREILNPYQKIGRSNGSIKEALESDDMGVDYLAIGAIFGTDTMGKSHRKPLGEKIVSEIKSKSDLPVVAIGGIGIDNLDIIKQSGADSVCIVSAITYAENPELSAKKIVDLWDGI